MQFRFLKWKIAEFSIDLIMIIPEYVGKKIVRLRIYFHDQIILNIVTIYNNRTHNIYILRELLTNVALGITLYSLINAIRIIPSVVEL
jgi:hypothetical protein